jgi:hypothetical protein
VLALEDVFVTSGTIKLDNFGGKVRFIISPPATILLQQYFFNTIYLLVGKRSVHQAVLRGLFLYLV